MTSRLWVVDTNVVVAGILAAQTDAPPARILHRMLVGTLRFAVSVELLAEYRAVLLRTKIRARHGLAVSEIDAVLEALAINAVAADISRRCEAAPDPGDDHLWRLIAETTAVGLITGDMLLLKNPPADVRVLTPRGWVDGEVELKDL